MKQKEQSHHSTTLLEPSKDTKKDRYRKSEAVKYLDALALDNKRAKYPNIPEAYLTVYPFKDNSANGLTKCVIAFIQLKGGQAERISTTGRAIDRTQTFEDVTGRTRTIGRVEWIKGNTTTGSADISATIQGRSVKIEVKMNDKQSPAQKEYQRAVEAAGGIYFIARSFEAFLTWYNQNFNQEHE